MTGCVFCDRIAADEYEPTEVAVVCTFEPLGPVVPGHRLFVPLLHVRTAADAPAVTGAVFEAAARHARQVGEPFNLITSAGAAASQTVWHLHVHYVPRREGDGLRLPWTAS